ncbi:MAG TPA: hypothetical protein VJU79_02430 [Candidatus Dormibacteraeota bacterium]|nr:hypothetical protein [Candidatus Dormibacteraeota bacterium]
MNKLSCVMCGQRYHGTWSPDLVCDFCHAPLEESSRTHGGRRAGMVPIPLVRPPLPAYPQSGESLESVLAGFSDRMSR